MTTDALPFFGLFTLVLVLSYIGIRREWASMLTLATIGTIGSIISMMLVSLAQGNTIAHALLVGIVVGGLFALVVVSAAWFFHNSESKGRVE